MLTVLHGGKTVFFFFKPWYSYLQKSSYIFRYQHHKSKEKVVLVIDWFIEMAPFLSLISTTVQHLKTFHLLFGIHSMSWVQLFMLTIQVWSEVKSLSHVWLFKTPWTVAYQIPPSMGFSRQEYWNGLPFPSPGDLPDPGIEPRSPIL